MNPSTFNQSRHWTLLVPLLMLVTLIFLLTNPILKMHDSPSLYTAITIDLTLLLPVIYLLIIREKKIPKLSAVPLFIIGIVIATFLIPVDQQSTLDIVKSWLLSVVEIGVLSFVVIKVRKFLKAYKKTQNITLDFYDAIVLATSEFESKRLQSVLASELSLIYYSLFSWRRLKLNTNEFSYYRKSSIIPILYGFMMVVIAEGIGVHIWLMKWNITLAWIFSALSIYALLQVFGMIKAIPKRPVALKSDRLQIRFGLMGDMSVPYNKIERVEHHSKDLDESDKSIKKLNFVEHNVLIHFKENQHLTGMYGWTKQCMKLAIFIDDESRFIQELNQKIEG